MPWQQPTVSKHLIPKARKNRSTQCKGINGRRLSPGTIAQRVLPTTLSGAISPTALATLAQRFSHTRTISHKLNRFPQRVTQVVCRTVLTLVTNGHCNAAHVHNSPDVFLSPRGRLCRVFVKEVATLPSLQSIKFHAKANVDHGASVLLGDHSRVPSVFVQVLPRTESSAHRRAYQQHRLLLLHHGPGPLPVLQDIKIPR